MGARRSFFPRFGRAKPLLRLDRIIMPIRMLVSMMVEMRVDAWAEAIAQLAAELGRRRQALGDVHQAQAGHIGPGAPHRAVERSDAEDAQNAVR